ncbi:hypothetical protein DDZ13_14610 [Coraliomargarita sinensis]|uniref:Uncharacterized protein n=1 Tax=Coraliomargarita sinensis TaxID=2174842 RepID=A0A317ZHU7_9BACT|nr:hypothetical protein [Coraliomargarita sinensis]PXA02931.1 hypothetical protein DDZ13_14610 [Coraliomargarita sinensis]
MKIKRFNRKIAPLALSVFALSSTLDLQAGGNSASDKTNGRTEKSVFSLSPVAPVVNWETYGSFQTNALPANQFTGVGEEGLIDYKYLLGLRVASLRVMQGDSGTAPTGESTLIDSLGIDTNNILTESLGILDTGVEAEASTYVPLSFEGGTLMVGVGQEAEPVVTQGNAIDLLDENFVFRSARNSGSKNSFLLEGRLEGPGMIPMEGDGVRLMWFPETASFRAGYGTSGWNENRVGLYSAAFGDSTEASGSYSFAAGDSNIAAGDGAVAFGLQNQADLYLSTVFGRYNLSGRSDWSAGSMSSWDAGDPLFELGIGTGAKDADRANALTVLKSGRIILGPHQGFPDSDETLQIKGPALLGNYSDMSAASPTPGAVRYDAVNDVFEGYLADADGAGNPGWALLSIIRNEIKNWDEAYRWGDHSSAGYLRVESDPDFESSPAADITQSEIENWNAGAYTNQWLTGASAPASEGDNDDLFLNVTTGDYFQKVEGDWVALGNLTGPPGPAGRDGVDGDSFFTLTGSGVTYNGGGVGIGTEPTEALEVDGNIKTSGAVILSSHAGDIPGITY